MRWSMSKRVVTTLVGATALLAGLGPAPVTAGAAEPLRPDPAGVRVLGWGFGEPDAVAFAGPPTFLWQTKPVVR